MGWRLKMIRRVLTAGVAVSLCSVVWGQSTTFDPEVFYRGTLVPVNGGPNARVGTSVSLDFTAVLAGAPQDQFGINKVGGRAYLFDLATGLEGVEYEASDGFQGDLFGTDVKLGPSSVIIGAPRDDDGAPGSGSVYVFSRDANPSETKLGATDPQQNAEFGSAVDMDGGFIVVGAPTGGIAPQGSIVGDRQGAVYVFSSDTLLPLRKLVASNGAFPFRFGFDVAIDQGIVVVGAPGAAVNGNGSSSGAAYVFDAATGQELGILTAPDAQSSDNFGQSVAIDQGLIVVGASLGTTGNGTDTGSVYVFDSATLDFKYEVDRPVRSGARLGQSVAVEQNLVAAGAPFAGGSGTFGQGFLFDGGFGAEIERFRADESISGDRAGESIDLFGTVLLLGAPEFSNGAGGVHVFDLIDFSPLDLDRDQDVDNDDIITLIGFVAADDQRADFFEDGVIDFFDVIRYLTVFQPEP